MNMKKPNDHDTFTRLLTSLVDQTAVIGVVGLGYVGLPLLIRYCEVGYNVIGFDVDHKRSRA